MFLYLDDFPMTQAGLREEISEKTNMLDVYKIETSMLPGNPVTKQLEMRVNFRNIVEDQYKDDELYQSPPQEIWDAYFGDKSLQSEQKLAMKENVLRIMSKMD